MSRVLDRLVFAALGTTCSVACATTPLELPSARRAVVAARAEIDACERVLSRFDPASDLARANAAAGTWVAVDERLVDALGAALWFRTATGGRCDPTLLPALAAAGYDRSFELLDERPAGPIPAAADDIEVDVPGRRIRVPHGAAVDLGATAKGWIALRALAVARHAWPRLPGALVDVGGDVAVAGSPPEGGPWRIDVEDPRVPGAVLGTIRVGAGGGVATSGPSRRRFGPDSSFHHLIDPRTREPMAGGPLAVTVVAADPVAAEAHSTALAVTPVEDAPDYLAGRPGLGALVLCDDGQLLVLGELDFEPIRTWEVVA